MNVHDLPGFASTPKPDAKIVDGRDKPGHDEEE
jgi:hypothetical protein